jgi:hypothetical protein
MHQFLIRLLVGTLQTGYVLRSLWWLQDLHQIIVLCRDQGSKRWLAFGLSEF